MGRVAQLVRAAALQAVGHRFDSCSAYQIRTVAYPYQLALWCSLVNTPACHAEDREFKSRRGRSHTIGYITYGFLFHHI